MQLGVLGQKRHRTRDASDAYICLRYSKIHTVAETIDRPDFYHREYDVAEPL